MAYKAVQDKLEELTKQADRIEEQRTHVNKLYAEKMNELLKLKQFMSLEKDHYISTTLGKGTVLAVTDKGKDKIVKVFLGQGETARIVNIKYWQFQGLN